MPILKPQKVEPDISVSAKFPVSLKKEMDQYIKFAGLKSVSEFLNRAAEFVFSKDKDWKNFKTDKDS